MASRNTTPFFLTTGPTPVSVVVTGGRPGPQAALPTLDLTNTLREPIQITELHFVVSEPSGVPDGVLMFAFEMILSVGRYQIMPRFTPIVALGPRSASIRLEGTGTALSPIASDQIRWILPRPLFLAPNETLNGAVRLSPNVVPFAKDGTAQITMVARGSRVGGPLPTQRAVPYASGWIFTASNVPPADDTIFQNIFPGVLHVQAISAQGLTVGNGFPQTAGVAVGSRAEITAVGPGGFTNEVLRSIATRADEGGFFGQRFSFETSHDLNPREGYSITLSDAAVAGVYAGSAVALTGWREE